MGMMEPLLDGDDGHTRRIYYALAGGHAFLSAPSPPSTLAERGGVGLTFTGTRSWISSPLEGEGLQSLLETGGGGG